MVYLVEESTLLKLSPNLIKIIEFLSEKKTTHNDYLIALAITVFKEADFIVKNNEDRGDYLPLELDPRQWKINGAYRINLEHRSIRELNCKFDAIPVGDLIILNLTSINNNIKTRCTAVETLEFVNLHSSDVNSRFMNLKTFSHRIKNNLTTPLKCDVLNHLGVVNPSLPGLPEELILKILSMLSEVDQINLHKTCQKFENLFKSLYENKSGVKKFREYESYMKLLRLGRHD
ncbi:F-box only protein 7-like [Cotesia glomerata]|uniref:F-box domain-containing protein n=1 Tax=Cotesia glomerata TaxID=32391 RepID=A0AAV7IVG3_COTGL|nr:F-box only protein 7-like [Cotesia glomerata]KAH0560717.1 hypothetical protein KQX54_007524 [Cotesia glomerata]